MKKIAVIGSGISGLTCAHYLQNNFDVTVFEKNDYVGGHTATKTVSVAEGDFDIDTGFIVFNDWTYPNFIRLLDSLGVESLATDMGFSVSCENTGLEYSGTSLATMFAQKRNWLSLKHWRFIRDIIKFNKVSKARLEQGELPEELTLGEYVKELNMSQRFVEQYIIPMGAAIWSSGLAKMYEFPALYFIRFFKNHGLLNLENRPQWSVIRNGSKSYVNALLEQSSFSVRCTSKIQSVIPVEDNLSNNWLIKLDNGEEYEFEHVIFACHSDEAIALLPEQKSDARDILSKISYSKNEVVLHTDQSLLPTLKSTWSSWNYKIRAGQTETATLSYSMNILQRLNCDTQFIVTLNDTNAIDEETILGQYQYAHPVYDRGTLEAQAQRSTINGKDDLWFCGAYWYAGFHEDGVRSGLDVVKGLGVDIEIL